MPKHAHTSSWSLAVGVVTALMLLGGCQQKPDPADAQDAGNGPANAVLTVTAGTTEPRTLQRTLTATGSLHAWEELTIAPQLGGYRVDAVNADVGDHVTAGTELARLDSAELAADVRARQAAVAKAEAVAARAAAEHRRGKQLAGQRLLSMADLEKLDSERLAAAADVALARANLEIAEIELSQTRILAPADGVISARSVNLGEVAQANGAMFRMLREGRVEWRAEVPESRLAQLQPGMAVRIHTAEGMALAGRLRTIAPSVDPDRRTALVYVDLPSPGSARPGMFARGDFLLESVTVPMVPLASVVRADGYSYVFMLGTDGRVERRRIETGAVDGDWVEVVAGLGGEERIVHLGAGFLKDGDQVDVAPATAVAGTDAQAAIAPGAI